MLLRENAACKFSSRRCVSLQVEDSLGLSLPRPYMLSINDIDRSSSASCII